MLVSIIVRTYNEERYLDRLLTAIAEQEVDFDHEVLLVDSGSSDDTLRIALRHGTKVLSIPKQDFSFGRSLNRGCAAAGGECLVFVSGHCVPVDNQWLARLVAPIRDQRVALTYGRQLGGHESKFSEKQLFAKFYPELSRIPQEGFFCNNANAAVRRDLWERHRFNEELTGLEDLFLGQALVRAGQRIGYVANATVHHFHHESWPTVRRRYEREAIAMQHIMPEIQITALDFVRYFFSAVRHDLGDLAKSGARIRDVQEVILFRFMQFWGSYRGNHEHRQLSRQRKEMYFYPR
jgi:rhamnosyltransferase